jgi:hypothetical protein
MSNGASQQTPSAQMSEYTLDLIRNEVIRARALYPTWQSTHHGYAVMLEEVDELWDEVRKRAAARDKDNMRRECVQIAAMAIRFIEELLK